MNRVCLVGRLTTKPELRYTNSNLPYTRFSLAVNRNFSNAQGQRETDFINIVVWRKQAENVCNYLDKGSLVSVEGRIQTESYDGQDGNKRYTTDVVADNVSFLESKKTEINSSEKETADETTDPFEEFGEQVSIDDDFLEDDYLE